MPSASSARACVAPSPQAAASAHAWRKPVTPCSTAPAATAASPASRCARAAIRSPRTGSPAARPPAARWTAGDGSTPSSRRNRRRHASTCASAAARSPVEASARTSSSWCASSNGSSATSRAASSAARSALPGGQLVERVLVEDCGRLAGVAPARHQQPRLERRARVELHVLEQLAAGGRRSLARVDHDVGCERQLDRVAGDRRRVAERAPQLGQVPAQRAERVVGIGEQQLRQPPPADRPFGQQQVGEQRPRLAPARRGGRLTIAQDGGLAQQSDTGLHAVTLA